MIKNLVLEGGGVKGVAYAGAYKALTELGLLNNLEKVAGASVGSIAALIISLGYSPDEMKSIIWGLDFTKFKDSWLPFRILTKYGLYKGDYALKWIESLVYKATGKKNATFSDLKGKYKDLHVVACDLNTKSLIDFCLDNTPNVIVSEAVRCSMSIPILFDAFRLTSGYTNHLFVDGGLVWNLPLEIFDIEDDNPETLGIALWDYNGAGSADALDYGSFFKYIGALLSTISRSQSSRIEYLRDEMFRIIKIDDFGISSTDFKISDENKQNLFESGFSYTKNHFD